MQRWRLKMLRLVFDGIRDWLAWAADELDAWVLKGLEWWEDRK
jgi:hypothetical protein